MTEKKGKRPTITLQDGTAVEPRRAADTWALLKDFPQAEPAAFQWLLAQVQGRPAEADARALEALLSRGFLNEDHSIDPLTRDVLLNSYTVADGKPMIAALRLEGDADKAVLEEARAQSHQENKEGYARSVSPGGWFDRLKKKIQRERGTGKSLD